VFKYTVVAVVKLSIYLYSAAAMTTYLLSMKALAQNIILETVVNWLYAIDYCCFI
jgi:hypothetical protein